MRVRAASPVQGMGVSARMLILAVVGALITIGGYAGIGWLGGGALPGVSGLPEASRQNFEGRPRFVRSIDGIARPIGVTTSPDGRVYVTEGSGSRRIRAFDAGGGEVGSFVPPDSASRGWLPMYAAVSPTGEVYVTDGGVQTVHVFGRDGSLLRDLAPPEGGWSPLGIAFAPDGRLFVTDVSAGQHRVLLFDANDALVAQFGTEGSADGEFSFPNAVAVDRQGRIFVSDSNNRRVQAFDPDGTFVSSIGGAAARFAAPRGIAVDGDDRLFVVDTMTAAVSVFDVSAAPKLLYQFGGPTGITATPSYPNGLALDGGGRIYVADRQGNRLLVWNRD